MSTVSKKFLDLDVASARGAGIVSRLENYFDDNLFDLIAPVIFDVDASTAVDNSSTGSYLKRQFKFSNSSETFVSVNLADPDEFLKNTDPISELELVAVWDVDSVDTAATYHVSRNGGNEWQAVTMERVGLTDSYIGKHTFSIEAVDQTLLSQATNNTTKDLDATNQQIISQPIVVASGSKLFVKELIIGLTKTGSPSGNIFVSICADNSGDPSTTLVETNAISVSNIVTGDNTVNVPDTYLTEGTYHIKIRTDSSYKGSYSNGVTSLAVQVNSSGATPYLKTYNGSVWSVSSTDNMKYSVKGFSVDLRVKITSSVGSKLLDAIGVSYSKSVGGAVTGIQSKQSFVFSGDTDETEFTVTRFAVNPETLKIYRRDTGAVYLHGLWALDGNKVIFPSGQFLDAGKTITLIFEQFEGSGFDNSEQNGLLLASNNLGSTDASIDKSVAGRGIFLRRPDGTLVELTIDNNNNINVFST